MDSDKQRVNGQIREKRVRLILPDGKMHGDADIQVAKRLADDYALDLVEVSPSSNGTLPVCKILDYGKLQYHNRKKSHEHNHQDIVKTIKFTMHISEYDLKRKREQALKFLSKKYRVKYVLELRGRERFHTEDAREHFQKELMNLTDKASWVEVNASKSAVSVVLRPAK